LFAKTKQKQTFHIEEQLSSNIKQEQSMIETKCVTASLFNIS